MKPAALLTLLISAMTVTAVPVSEADVDSSVAQVETRDLTRGQCKAACDRGTDAFERFCGKIRDPIVRGACELEATAVQTPLFERACTIFCDKYF